MSTPITTVVDPSKSKTWIGLVGSLLTFAIPALLQIAGGLEAPWPAVAAAVVAVLTALGVYRAPYKPADTTIVNNSDIPAINAGAQIVPDVSNDTKPAPAPAPAVQQDGEFHNPWK